jgi:hypothetical protein
MAFQLRRGTNAQRSAITPLQGELLYTTDTKTLYVGDGTTAGGTLVSGGGGSGALYAISAETTTGGATLRLTGSDSSTDDVKLQEGANVSITRTDINTITISSTGAGGAVDLDDLGDVVITGTPSSGDVLKWDSGLGFWVNGAAAGGTLDNLSDVVIAGTLTTGDVLKWDSVLGFWINSTPSTSLNINDLTDVVITAPVSPGDILIWNGVDSTWVNSAPPTDARSLLENGTQTGITFSYDLLTDTLTSTVATSLTELTDVTLGTLASGDILRWDGFAWTESTETQWLVEDDPSPSLTANLDLNGSSITGTGDLDIAGNLNAATLSLGSSTAGYASGISVLSEAGFGGSTTLFDLSVYNSTAAGASTFFRSKGTVAAPVALAANDAIHSLIFTGLGTNTTGIPTASSVITSKADPNGTIGTLFAPGQLEFRTKNDAGVMNTALTLNRDGKIAVLANTLTAGVGSGQVDVAGGAVSYLYIKVGSTEYALPLFGLNP